MTPGIRRLLDTYMKISWPAKDNFSKQYPIVCGDTEAEMPTPGSMRELIVNQLVVARKCGATERVHYLLTERGEILHDFLYAPRESKTRKPRAKKASGAANSEALSDRT